MCSHKSWRIGLVSAAIAALPACDHTPGPGDASEMTNTARLAGASGASYDSDVDLFLPEYVREHHLLADDELEYDVANGAVTIRGSVDSDSERDQLERRVRRVPGVREVDLSGVQVGER